MSALNFPTGASMCLVATTQAKTINLPTPDTGRLVYIVDSTGGANLNPITVSTSGSGVAICNGYSTIVQPFGTLGYLANNNNWYAIVNESGVDNWRTIIASNVSAAVVSTNYGFFSTISSGSVYGKHFGDGSLLTGLPASGLTILPPVLSTTVMSSGILTGNLISTLNLSTTFGYISSLTVDSLSFGVANGFINMGDVITTSISSIQTFTSSLLTTNLQVGIVSSLSYIAFPGLQLGYNQSVIAEQSIGTGLQELLLFKGSTNTDRIRMQTTGTIVFEPGVSARVFPSASSNATPAMIITTGSNVGIGVLAPGVSLDVAGAGRFTALSVNTLSTNQVNSSNICNVGWLSNGGALSNLGGGAFFAGTSNTTTLGVAGTATLAGVTLTSLSNSGNFSNAGYISNSGALSNLGGTAYFAATSNTTTLGVAGTATLAGVTLTSLSNSGNFSNAGYISNSGALSNLGGTAYFAATSNTTTLGVAGTATLAGVTLTSLSNSGNFSNAGYISNSGALSNLGGTAYFAATSNTTTLGVAGIFTAASNITQTGGTTTLTGLSVNTISTNFISACNISSYSLSTTLGYFSTISSGAFYGKYIGDGSLLTGLPAAGITSLPSVISAITLSTTNLIATNISTFSISTAYGFFSTISTGSVYGKHIGDGSLLTGITTTSTFTTVTTTSLTVTSGAGTINFTGSSNTSAYGTGVDTLSLKSQLTAYGGGIASLFFGNATAGYPLARIYGIDSAGSAPGASALVFQTAVSSLNASLSGINIFSYTGADQSYTIPSGVTSVTISMWSGGGGSGATGTAGANGYYISGTLLVSAGQVLKVIVASGGIYNSTATSYGGGGGAGSGGGGASGGGRSALQLQLTAVITSATASGSAITYTTSSAHGLVNGYGVSVTNINATYNQIGIVTVVSTTQFSIVNSASAGSVSSVSGIIYLEIVDVGGGGGSYQGSGDGPPGAGGLTTGGNGLAPYNGQGATQTAGGTGGTYSSPNGSNGSLFTGGASASGRNGGGGGGGWYGGGGGDNYGGGGGGSSYTSFSNFTLAANGFPGNSDTYYVSGLGAAGTGNGVNGGNGRVVIAAAPSFVMTEAMRISSNAYVGIGMSNPSTMLDVAGTVRASTLSSMTMNVNYGLFSTISTGSVYGKYIGDGSLLTGLPATMPAVFSTLAFYASSISTTTIQTSNILLGTVSSLSYLAFPGLQQQYAQSVLAEVSTGTGLQEMLLFRGSTATDRIRMQTTGSIIFETGVGARVFPAAPSNATPAMIINTSSNVGIGIAAPTVTLDVAGAGRFQTLSSQQIYASSFVGGVVSVATVYATTVSSLAGFFSTVNNYQIGGALYLPTQIFTF